LNKYDNIHVVPNHPSAVSHLHKYVEIAVYKTALVPVLHSCETLFLILRGEQGVGENIGPEREGYCTMRSFII
jgi:hypothetical protein